MAARSNRSPSPLCSRPMNPNSRNSESNPTIRRSFGGHGTLPKPSFLTCPRILDPTTPANSPSDFAARRSMGREGIGPHLRECEVEKENDEKENAWKLQSPAKGCKNFMAPTISAASKFTPSPRKKVLVERNDPVRTSISFSGGKAMFFSQDSEQKSESNLADSKTKKAAVVEGHPVPKPCKKVTFSEIHSDESVVTEDSDSLNLESKVPPPPPPPPPPLSSIAPLDADPSLPPYDPKTNYLSPRPQFIRYRLNPRVEILKTMDPNEFDDSLMAENMSEVLSDNDDKEEMADLVIGMDEEIDAGVSESLPVSATPVEEVVESVESNEKKPRGVGVLLSRLMILLLLVAACVSVSVKHAPPSFDQLLIKDLSFDGLSKIYEQSRVGLSLEGVVRQVHHVSVKSVSLILKLVNEVVVQGQKQAVPLKFMNLSDLEESCWKEEGYFLKRVENVEYQEDLDAEMEYEFDEDGYVDEEEAVVEDDAESDAFEEEEYVDSVVATEETVEEVAAHSESEYAAADSQVEEAAAVVMEAEATQGHVNVGASDDAETSLSSPMAEATPAQVRSSLGLAVVACSVFAAVAGAAAFVYRYKGRESGVPISKSEAEQQPSIIHQEKEISERWETEESQMSSSYWSRSYANEVERKTATSKKHPRRESLASSSGGLPSPSLSYGSFTTYERIPIKINQGCGEDEIITPVRRSSRIRNQATSPAA